MRRFAILLASAAVVAPSVHAGEDIPGVVGGYHDGFYLKTPDDRFLFKVGSRLNFGYTYGFVSPQTDFSSFDLHHAKLYAGGNAFGRTFRFYLQAGGATNSRAAGLGPDPESSSGSFTLEDYYGQIGGQGMSVKFGQFKVPYGRQAMMYSGNLEFVGRTYVTRTFTFGRDRGVTLNAEQPAGSLTLGVFNGGGTPPWGGLRYGGGGTLGHNASNDTSGGGKGHLYVARFVAKPLGAVGYSEGDVETTQGHALDVGLGFVFDHGRDLDFTGDGLIDDTDADTLNASAEVAWKSEGRSLQGEFFYSRLWSAAVGDSNRFGFYVQPAYFLVPGRVEAAARFGWSDPNSAGGLSRTYEAAGVLNLYFSPDHRYKLQVAYTFLGRKPVAGPRNDDGFVDIAFQLTI